VKKNTSLETAENIASLAADKKGKDIVLMDMSRISAFCDWFVLVSANTPRQINAISKHIRSELSKKKVKPINIEGEKDQDWVLIDYEDVIVHIFQSNIREFYDLEHMWSEAPKKYID